MLAQSRYSRSKDRPYTKLESFKQVLGIGTCLQSISPLTLTIKLVVGIMSLVTKHLKRRCFYF